MAEAIKTITISEWARKAPDGKYLKQVVVKYPAGKNQKGKKIYRSKTMHVPA